MEDLHTLLAYASKTLTLRRAVVTDYEVTRLFDYPLRSE